MRKPISAIIVSSALALAGVALAGCSPGGDCPPMPTYSAAQQDKAASELARLPAGAQIGVMIVDYGKVRRACREARQ